MPHLREVEVSAPSKISGTVKYFPMSTSEFYDSSYGFNSIRGQENAVFMLKKMLQCGNIPNAILLTGNRDTGKQKAALSFAMAINCQGHDDDYQGSVHKFKSPDNTSSDESCINKTSQIRTGISSFINDSDSLNKSVGKSTSNSWQLYRDEPCNECISCKKILSGMHPDIIIISPEKDKIKIAQIRKINATLTMKPNEAEMRMVLIEDAGKMNKEASNALLKILEEPPDKTFFILISENITGIIPTIISRCLHIRFSHTSCKSLKLKLIKDYNIDPVMASIAADYSNGSITKALMFAGIKKQTDNNTEYTDTPQNTPNWIKTRQWLIGEVSGIMADKRKNRTDVSIVLAMAAKLSSDPDYAQDSILIIKTWLRDLVVYRYSPDKIINHDFSSVLEDITQWVGVQKIISWFKALNAAENKIKSNTSTRLALECFFLKLI